MHIADREPFRLQREGEQSVAKAREKEQDQEQDGERWQRYKSKIRREWAERSERQRGENEVIAAPCRT